MKIVTFDGKFQVVTDETPHGCYVLLLPTNDWTGGYIIGKYAHNSEAHAVLKQLTEKYARLAALGYALQQSPTGPCFTHPDGRTDPLVPIHPNIQQKEA